MLAISYPVLSALPANDIPSFSALAADADYERIVRTHARPGKCDVVEAFIRARGAAPSSRITTVQALRRPSKHRSAMWEPIEPLSSTVGVTVMGMMLRRTPSLNGSAMVQAAIAGGLAYVATTPLLIVGAGILFKLVSRRQNPPPHTRHS